MSKETPPPRSTGTESGLASSMLRIRRLFSNLQPHDERTLSRALAALSGDMLHDQVLRKNAEAFFELLATDVTPDVAMESIRVTFFDRRDDVPMPDNRLIDLVETVSSQDVKDPAILYLALAWDQSSDTALSWSTALMVCRELVEDGIGATFWQALGLVQPIATYIEVLRRMTSVDRRLWSRALHNLVAVTSQTTLSQAFLDGRTNLVDRSFFADDGPAVTARSDTWAIEYLTKYLADNQLHSQDDAAYDNTAIMCEMLAHEVDVVAEVALAGRVVDSDAHGANAAHRTEVLMRAISVSGLKRGSISVSMLVEHLQRADDDEMLCVCKNLADLDIAKEQLYRQFGGGLFTMSYLANPEYIWATLPDLAEIARTAPIALLLVANIVDNTRVTMDELLPKHKEKLVVLATAIAGLPRATFRALIDDVATMMLLLEKSSSNPAEDIAVIVDFRASPIYSELGGQETVPHEAILKEIISSTEPRAAYRRVMRVLEHQRLPGVATRFLVFQALHPPERLQEELDNNQKDPSKDSTVSPSLRALGVRGAMHRIYRDLVWIELASGSPELRSLLTMFRDAQHLLDVKDYQETDTWSPSARQLFIKTVHDLDSLLSISSYARMRSGLPHSRESDVMRAACMLLDAWKASLDCDENLPLSKRVYDLLLWPVGIGTPEEALNIMDDARVAAEQSTIDGPVRLEAGDLIRSVQSRYLRKILSGGSVSKEHLGLSADKDHTPHDIDLMRLKDGDQKNLQAFHNMMKCYGDIRIIVRDRGQFTWTSKVQLEDPDAAEQLRRAARRRGSQWEAFYTEVIDSGRHVGIRTGLPSSAIAAIMIDIPTIKTPDFYLELRLLVDTMVDCGRYIPVVDQQGQQICTRRQYDSWLQHRVKALAMIDNRLGATKLNTKDLLGILNIPLTMSYDMDADVAEKQTIGEHTGMVLKQFEKYYDKRLPPLMSRAAWRLLFALHDVGKPEAIMHGDKKLQHEFTYPRVRWLIEGCKILTSQERFLMRALLVADPIGGYLQGQLDAFRAARQIKHMSDVAELSIRDFYPCLLAYFQIDASAYTVDAGSKPSLEKLFVQADHDNPRFAQDNDTGRLLFSDNTRNELSKLEAILFAS